MAAAYSPGREPGVTVGKILGSPRRGRQNGTEPLALASGFFASPVNPLAIASGSVSVAPTGLTNLFCKLTPGLRPGLYAAARTCGLIEWNFFRLDLIQRNCFPTSPNMPLLIHSQTSQTLPAFQAGQSAPYPSTRSAIRAAMLHAHRG